MLTREETLGCIYTLGSSLYNYAASNGTWPHWKSCFYKIDDYFGWQRGGDITVEQDFTFLSSTKVYSLLPVGMVAPPLELNSFGWFGPFFPFSTFPTLYACTS